MAIISNTEVNYFKDGVLTLGADDDVVNVASRAREVELSPETDKEDDILVLNSDVIPGASKTTWKLSLTMVPDFGTENSIWEYFYENDGKIVPFTFTPSGNTKKRFSGSLVVTPAGISGEAGSLGEAEVELAVIGKPTISA